MPIIEILKQNYKGEPIRAVSELVRESEMGLPILGEIFDIVPGIKGKQKVGYVGGVEKITRKDEGCGTEGMSITPPSREVLWNPEGLKIHIKECYKDWFDNWMEWSLANGIKKQDLTTNEYFLFLVDLIEGGIAKDFFRYVLFGNKNHTAVGATTGTKVLKAGELPVDFNLLDGYFAKMDAEIASNPHRKYTISTNAGADYAAQRALPADEAFKAAEFLLDNADGRMFNDGAEPIFLATWSMAQNLKRYMREKYKDEKTFDRVQFGFELYEFDGIKLVTNRYIDQILRRDFDNGTKWDRPHRLYLLDKKNNRIGLDSEASLTDIEVEYIGGDDEHNHVKASYLADFQRPYSEFGTVAF